MDADEVEVLQSIFEETDVFYYNSNKQTCKLFIPIEVDISEIPQIKHLPPIKLTAKTPKVEGFPEFDYPDVLPLNIDISASWLEERHTSKLQAHLLEQFEPGNVMLYDSFTAVQESWQEILSGMLDFAAISTNKNCLDFNRSKLLVEFNEETHRCGSCKVRKNGAECVYEDACGHVVCKSCLQSIMDIELQGATLTPSRPYPKCPATGCNEKITKSVQVLQEVLSHASFEVYNELLTRSLLGTQCVQVIHTCPRTECNFKNSILVEVSANSADAQSMSCKGCPYVFCTKCRQSAHSGKCKFCFEHCSQILSRLKNREKINISQELSIFNLNEVLSSINEAIQNEPGGLNERPEKTCGNCKRLVKKDDEYNCVLCPYCSKYFCWICQKSLRKEKGDPKMHFDPNKYPKSSCANKLINQSDVKRKGSMKGEWMDGMEKLYEKCDYSLELEKLCCLVKEVLVLDEGSSSDDLKSG